MNLRKLIRNLKNDKKPKQPQVDSGSGNRAGGTQSDPHSLRSLNHDQPVTLQGTRTSSNTERVPQEVLSSQQELLFTDEFHSFEKARSLYRCFEMTGDIGSLEATINLCEVLAQQTSDVPEQFSLHLEVQCLLANALWNNLSPSDKLNNHQAFRKIIGLYSHVFGSQDMPWSGLDKLMACANYAQVVWAQYLRLGKQEDLSVAVQLHRQSVELCPTDYEDRPSILNSCGNVLRRFYQEKHDATSLNEAIALYKEAWYLSSLNSSERSLAVFNYANAVQARFKHTGSLDDLRLAIQLHETALTLHSPDKSRRSNCLISLANATLIYFKHQGDVEYLNQSMAFSKEALTLCPPGHINRLLSINSCANAIFASYNYLNNPQDLNKAIELYMQGLAMHPPGHPQKILSLINLATAIKTRHAHFGSLKDITYAIELYEQALKLCSPDHVRRGASLSSLANALKTYAQQTSDIEILYKAIELYKQALDLYETDHPDWPAKQHNLAIAIQLKYQQLGDINDLDQSIKLLKEILHLCSLSNETKLTIMQNLATAISSHYQLTGDLNDWIQADTLYEQALALPFKGQIDKANTLTSFAKLHYYRFEQEEDIQYLEMAFQMHIQAFNLYPNDHSRKSNNLHCLATMIQTKSKHLESLKAIMQLNSVYSNALRDHLQSIARIVSHDSNFSITDSLAYMLWQCAIENPSCSVFSGLQYAIKWARSASINNHVSATQAYFKALELLDTFLVMRPSVKQQHKILQSFKSSPKSWAADACSCALNNQQYESAIELLEKGRSILWTKMLSYRFDLKSLRHADNALAQQFEQLSQQLEIFAIADIDDENNYIAHFEKYHKTKNKWNEIVLHIQELDGFQDFLQVVSYSQLQLAASEGPVIIINVSDNRSDALIISCSHKMVIIPLPAVSPAYVNELLEILLNEVHLRQQSYQESQNTIIFILQNLWHNIVKPVVAELQKLDIKEMSRIWWCPTGKLCGLPIHAAGPYEVEEKNLPDIYISSYTSTLSALIRARVKKEEKKSNIKLLIIAQTYNAENKENIKFLPNVEKEVTKIQNYINDATILKDSDATSDNVLSMLQTHHWIHFACHAYQETEPFDSSFDLYDKQLTLIELMKSQLPEAEMAFLSACSTASGDLYGTPDEYIHLASTLQFSGFKSVIGTMWPMVDGDGPIVARHFYKYLAQHGHMDIKQTAFAINKATRRLRDLGAPASRWINFIHIGA